jgi:hypothetical protein
MKGEHLFKHGLARSPAHRIWCKMKERCSNPNAVNYERYGGRGITVCSEWLHSFEQFFQDMGPRPSSDHSIERRDNSKPYCKDNCFWATRIEQANNKRNNRIVEYRGRKQSVAAWCRELGLNYHIVRQRIHRNKWTPERAFSI